MIGTLFFHLSCQYKTILIRAPTQHFTLRQPNKSTVLQQIFANNTTHCVIVHGEVEDKIKLITKKKSKVKTYINSGTSSELVSL